MIEPSLHFACPIYMISANQFSEIASEVSNDYVSKTKENNTCEDFWPLFQTENMYGDERLEEFCDTILNIANDILINQGYNLENFELRFSEMWCQEHSKSSGHDRHVHGKGCILSGFYFFQETTNKRKIQFHDPRAAKEFGDYLPEIDVDRETLASSSIMMIPQKGNLVFTNSWLPHSICRNETDEPFRFIHFNIFAQYDLSMTKKVTII